jgi:hypothetical protein
MLDELYWNVYTDANVIYDKTAAFVAKPRHTRRGANYAATCREDATSAELRRAGVCYRVVYRPSHPTNRLIAALRGEARD